MGKGERAIVNLNKGIQVEIRPTICPYEQQPMERPCSALSSRAQTFLHRNLKYPLVLCCERSCEKTSCRQGENICKSHVGQMPCINYIKFSKLHSQKTNYPIRKWSKDLGFVPTVSPGKCKREAPTKFCVMPAPMKYINSLPKYIRIWMYQKKKEINSYFTKRLYRRQIATRKIGKCKLKAQWYIPTHLVEQSK